MDMFPIMRGVSWGIPETTVVEVLLKQPNIPLPILHLVNLGKGSWQRARWQAGNTG
jgi:hypothetical protein